MTATWGRAHTMRWLASDPHAYLREWRRLAALEIGRALTDAARRPWRGDCWTRIAGAAAGIARSVVRWREIPSQPRSRDRWEGAA
jgi:hypothetical protein